MSEYSSSIEVAAAADKVFEFVSDAENMPKYLPTLNEAHMEGSDRVVMDGNVEGHSYHADGDLHLDPDEKSMHWGSDGNHKYRGQLQVIGDGERCNVAVKLVFEPGQHTEEKIEEQKGDAEAVIQQGLEKALESIKSNCEGAEVSNDPAIGYLY